MSANEEGKVADEVVNEEDAEEAIVAELTHMEIVLIWIGFESQHERDCLIYELGSDLSTFRTNTLKEMQAFSKLMAEKPAGQRVRIGFQRFKKLKSVIHWAQDRHRISVAIHVEGPATDLPQQERFLEELTEASQRETIRANSDESRTSRAKESSPGKLKDEQSYDKWEQGLLTMLSILQGVNGVPLCYVIREDEHQDGDTYPSFVDQCIIRARLQGPEFEADARTVHQILQSLTVGENAEHWLKDLRKQHNGRKDMVALRAHYRGAGNQSRRVNQAQKLKETLHYKNERAMKFSDFISKAKQMFNIFEECKEPQPETVKLRFLWDKVQSPPLQSAIDAMKANLGQDPAAWTFVQACDHLASQITAEGPTRAQFAASAIESAASDASPILMKNGKVNTGAYSKEEWWDVLSGEERKLVIAERKKTDGYTGGYAGKKKEKSNSAGSNRKIKALEQRLKKQGQKISAMRRAKNKNDASSSDDSEDGDNAGNAFGGRADKHRKKKKKKT